ncbi:hypothetical protein A3K73_00985 [Candidatus Pacearchaeota archaeon RBG_13_36_9]|nr:MAG: hypothetical protein A3K73_00985 [Candidatus Pacearchaeota archaeon RBG_13_36_9]
MDNTAPTLPAQNAPASDSLFNSNWVLLNCSGSIDADGDVPVYHYFGDMISGSTYLGANNTKTNYNWTGLIDGVYSWKCLAGDGRDNSSATSIRTFTIDSSPPAVELISPIDGSIVSFFQNSFGANFTDRDLSNATFYIWNSTRSLVAAQVKELSGISNSVSLSFVLPYDDNYTWNYYSCDKLNNCKFSDKNRTLTIDTTAPKFEQVKSWDIEIGQQINLEVNVSDRVGVYSVNASIVYPDYSTAGCDMVYSSGLWDCSSITLTLPGEYLVNYTVSDSLGNKNSTTDWFEVYDRYSWNVALSDYINSPVSGVGIIFYKSYNSKILLSNATDVNGKASFFVNKRFYDISNLISTHKFILRGVNFTNDSCAPILNYYLTSEPFEETILLHRFKDISSFGIAANSKGLENNPVNMTFDYSSIFYNISDLNKLEVVKCTNWDYANRTCLGQWDILASLRNISGKTITADSVGFGNNAYFLAENSCGTKGCEPAFGENSANCADCRVSPPDNGGGGGGGGGGGPLKPALNISGTVGGIGIGTSSIYEEMFSGDSKTVSVGLTNTLSKPASVTLAAEGEAASLLSFVNSTISLNAKESKDFLIILAVPKDTVPKGYGGKIIIGSGNKSGEIPVNIIVLSEGKLLDLKIQPLVSEIKAGGTLEVKVNVINLGSSNINGTFELQLVEAETGKTFVRSEEEFAVENSTEEIKKLKIPAGAKSGQYFVRGIANYNSLGKELQATSIASIAIGSEGVSNTSYLFYLVLAVLLILCVVIIVLIIRYLKNRKQPKQANKKEYKKQEGEGNKINLREESEETSLSGVKDQLERETKDLSRKVNIKSKNNEAEKRVQKGLGAICKLIRQDYNDSFIRNLFVKQEWPEKLVIQMIIKSHLLELENKLKSPRFGERDAKEIKNKLDTIRKELSKF